MLPFDRTGSQRFLPTIGYTNGSAPTSLSTPASNNTKGAWTNIGSLSRAISGFLFAPTMLAGQTRSFMVDLAIGNASGPIKTILANFLVSIGGFGGKSEPCPFPISVAFPNVIWARYQTTSITGVSFTVFMSPYTGGLLGHETLARIDTIGATTSTTRGVTVTPSASTSVPGSWADIGQVRFHTKFLVLSMGDTGTVPTQDTIYYGEIGVKNSAGLYFSRAFFGFSGGTFETFLPGFVAIPVDILPTYTLAVRAQPLNTTSKNNFDVVAHLVG